MSKITLNNVGSLIDSTTAAATINANSAVIQTAMDNTLSRNGASPNQMGASLDMNNNRILNLPPPISLFEPLRLQELNDLLTGEGTTAGTVPIGGSPGQVLAKQSNSNFDVNWINVGSELAPGSNITLTGTHPTTIATSANPTFTTVNTATVPTVVDTLVARNTTDTLTNKTLTSPVLNGTVSGTGVSNTNTVFALVKRDGSGNFAAGTITAALSGNATSATSATSATNTTNVSVTDDNTTNASMNLLWATSNTGNLPVKSSSSKLLFNPSSGLLSSTSFIGAGTGLTGTAAGLTAGNVTTNANLTGAVTSVGNATSLGSFTSADLKAAVTDETGSGALVFATSPTLTTPILGVTSSTSESITGTGGAGYLQLANQTTAPGVPTSALRLYGDTSGRLSWIGTNGFVRSFDGLGNSADRSYVLPDASGTMALTSNKLSDFAATTSAELASVISNETGSGALVFATSPTLVTPALGTPTSGVATNLTGTASGLTAGNVTTNANLTGAITSVGNATSLGSFTSANLKTALTDETGSGAAVFATSPLITTPDVVGTTAAGNANAGSLGEFVTGTLPSSTPVALTTNVTANVLSISLTAGDWDVTGLIGFTGGATTNVSYLYGGLNTTSATLPTNSYDQMNNVYGTTIFGVANGTIAIPVPKRRINVSSTTTVYLVGLAGFTVSTCSGYGKLEARRIR